MSIIYDPVMIDLERHLRACDEADAERARAEERARAHRRTMPVSSSFDCDACGETIELECDPGPFARHLTEIYPLHTVVYCDRCGEAYEQVAVDVDADGGPEGYVDRSVWTWESMRGEEGGR